MHYQPDRLAELYGAVARQALTDHRAGWTRKGIPSAYAFLRSAGLIDQRGQFIGRALQFTPSARKHKRKSSTPAISAGLGA